MYATENRKTYYESAYCEKTLGIVQSKVQFFIHKIHILVFPSRFVTLVEHPTFTWRIVGGLRLRFITDLYTTSE